MNGIGRFWSHKKGGKIYFHGIILNSNYCKIRSTAVGPAGSITIIDFFTLNISQYIPIKKSVIDKYIICETCISKLVTLCDLAPHRLGIETGPTGGLSIP